MVFGLRLLMRIPPRKVREKYTAYYCATTMLNYLPYRPLGKKLFQVRICFVVPQSLGKGKFIEGASAVIRL